MRGISSVPGGSSAILRRCASSARARTGSLVLAAAQPRAKALQPASRASALQDSLPVDFGPPVAVKPPHEYAGELLLRAGRADAAQAEFASSLQAAPRRAHSLLGLARANQALGNAEAARKAYEELAGIWASADAELPELAEARAAVRAGTPGD